MKIIDITVFYDYIIIHLDRECNMRIGIAIITARQGMDDNKMFRVPIDETIRIDDIAFSELIHSTEYDYQYGKYTYSYDSFKYDDTSTTGLRSLLVEYVIGEMHGDIEDVVEVDILLNKFPELKLDLI